MIDPTPVDKVKAVTPPTELNVTLCPATGVAGKATVNVVANVASWIRTTSSPVSAKVIVPLFTVEY